MSHATLHTSPFCTETSTWCMPMLFPAHLLYPIAYAGANTKTSNSTSIGIVNSQHLPHLYKFTFLGSTSCVVD